MSRVGKQRGGNMKTCTLAMLCASLVLTGCAVSIVPKPDMGGQEKLNLYVGLLIPKAEARRTAHICGKTLQTGNALKVGTMNTFQQVFTNVFELETWQQASATPDLMLLLQPRIVSLQSDANGHATVILGCRLTDLKDRVLLDSTWSGSSSPDEPAHQAGGSVEAGKGTIEKSCSEAFESAFKQLAGSVLISIRTSVR
jgi:hypothetical protein